MSDSSPKTVLLVLGACLLVIASMAVAATSLGVKCYNDNPNYKKRNSGSFEYLKWTVGFSVLALVGALVMIFGGVKAKST
jgi:hypothetical protein